MFVAACQVGMYMACLCLQGKPALSAQRPRPTGGGVAECKHQRVMRRVREYETRRSLRLRVA